MVLHDDRGSGIYRYPNYQEGFAVAQFYLGSGSEAKTRVQVFQTPEDTHIYVVLDDENTPCPLAKKCLQAFTLLDLLTDETSYQSAYDRMARHYAAYAVSSDNSKGNS